MNQAELKGFYSDEAWDIIGGEPTWIIRRGMIVLALVTLVLFCVFIFVPYPETVKGPITMTLNPTGNYSSKATIGLLTASKVRVGQKAIVQLTEFPPASYGMLEASVRGITESAMDSAYTVDIMLVNGLTTTLNKKITPKKILYGSISIATERTSLFRKIFKTVFRIF